MKDLKLTMTDSDTGRREQYDSDADSISDTIEAVCKANPDTRYAFVITVDATAAELDW